MKKLIISILALIMVLSFTGCGAELTAEEYAEAVKSSFSEYVDASKVYAELVNAGDYGAAKDALKGCDGSLNALATLNAPSKYKEQQSRLADGVTEEREYLKAVGVFLDFANTGSSTSPEFQAAVTAMNTAQKNSSLPTAVAEAVLTANKDIS